MKLCPIFVMVGVLAGVSGASAAWTGSKAFQSCIDSAGGNDPQMADCARQEFGRQDKRLNAAYAARMLGTEGKLKEAIRASQRAWLSDRDLTCEAEGAVYEGGTMGPLTQANCKARLTTERIDWLKELTP